MAKHALLGDLAADDSFCGEIRYDEPLARHTTLKVGGPARVWVRADSLSALAAVLGSCEAQGIPWFAMGRGSNLLVSDEGFPGAVITLGGDFKQWNYDPEAMEFTVGAAASLPRIVQEAFRQGVAGLEFAVGTPGSVGGALRMNAGTRTEWLGSRVVSATSYRPGSGLISRRASDVEWGYRRTSFPSDEVLVECVLSVNPAEQALIRAKMEEKLTRRKRTQPLDEPSCGSVFRNPEGASAGALIEGAGLSGARVGGARISPKHANFIVNTGGACAADVAALIDQARQKVKQHYGIELTTEVRFLGFPQ